MGSSLARSTQASRDSAVIAWNRFCEIAAIDIFCRYEKEPYSVSETIYVVMAFASFESIRGISPQSTFGAYLPSIKNFFISSNVHNNFGIAIKSDQVGYVKRGYQKIYHKIHPISESRKMAFTLDLVNYVSAAMRDSDIKNLDEWAIRAREVALRTGIYFLLRKSEFLPNNQGSQQGLQRKDILFFDNLGFTILCSLIQRGQAKSVKIIIPFSKCDQFGKGRNILHVRQTNRDRCIVRDLEEWVISTRVELGAGESDFLFMIKGKVLISSEQITKVMKITAEHCGFDSHKISAHSLRYGGATMLAAAGLPQYIIAYFGGWCEDSKSLQIYTQLNVSSNSLVSSIFSKGDKVTLEEARINQPYQLNSVVKSTTNI